MATTRTTLTAMRERLTEATRPEDVFGVLAGSRDEQKRALSYFYQKLSRACHPDVADRADAVLASEVFTCLTDWRTEAEAKIEGGTYGLKPISPTPPDSFSPSTPTGTTSNPSVTDFSTLHDRYHAASDYRPVTLTVRGKQLVTERLLGVGTFADVHAAQIDGFNEGAAFVKVARNPEDNDLLEREYRMLRRLEEPDDRADVEAFLQIQRVYAPRPLDTFLIPGANGGKHRAAAYSVPEGCCFTVEMLRTEKFPGGIEPRHVWWIFRRLLLTLWMAHLKNVVHGAVTPDHILVYPEAHGIVLLDWTCAAERKTEPIPAVSETWKAYYPPEVFAKKAARPEEDLYMAAATTVYMLGGDPTGPSFPPGISEEIRLALASCLHPDTRRRPDDAERFYNDFGELLGPRQYAHFVVP